MYCMVPPYVWEAILCICDMQFHFADSRLTNLVYSYMRQPRCCDLALWPLVNFSYLTVRYSSLTLALQCSTFTYLHAKYTIQTTGTAQGLLAQLSSLTFRLDNADYGQFPCCQTATCKPFPCARGNGSYALQRFKHSKVLKICNVIMFNFYPGLLHKWLQYIHTDILPQWNRLIVSLHDDQPGLLHSLH